MTKAAVAPLRYQDYVSSMTADAKVTIALEVNGEPAEVAFAPHKTLLEVLREDLNLTGTKHGCELGECGTCTCCSTGRPCFPASSSSRVRGAQGENGGRNGTGGRLHPLQETFADLGAAQCGYCTPRSSLPPKPCSRQTPSPPRGDQASLAGNLCRCTGYIKIYEAVELAAARMRARRSSRRGRRSMAGHRVVGKAHRKIDAVAKVTGVTKFADDSRSRACSTASCSAAASPTPRSSA